MFEIKQTDNFCSRSIFAPASGIRLTVVSIHATGRPAVISHSTNEYKECGLETDLESFRLYTLYTSQACICIWTLEQGCQVGHLSSDEPEIDPLMGRPCFH
jgi:hypothetical protein